MPGNIVHFSFTFAIGSLLHFTNSRKFSGWHILGLCLSSQFAPDIGAVLSFLFGGPFMEVIHNPILFIIFFSIPLSFLLVSFSRAKYVPKVPFISFQNQSPQLSVRQSFYLICSGALFHFFLDFIFEEDGKNPLFLSVIKTGIWDRTPIISLSVIFWVGLFIFGLFVSQFIYATNPLVHTFEDHLKVTIIILTLYLCYLFTSSILLGLDAVGEEADLGTLPFLTIFVFVPFLCLALSMSPNDEKREIERESSSV